MINFFDIGQNQLSILIFVQINNNTKIELIFETYNTNQKNILNLNVSKQCFNKLKRNETLCFSTIKSYLIIIEKLTSQNEKSCGPLLYSKNIKVPQCKGYMAFKTKKSVFIL